MLCVYCMFLLFWWYVCVVFCLCEIEYGFVCVIVYLYGVCGVGCLFECFGDDDCDGFVVVVYCVVL